MQHADIDTDRPTHMQLLQTDRLSDHGMHKTEMRTDTETTKQASIPFTNGSISLSISFPFPLSLG